MLNRRQSQIKQSRRLLHTLLDKIILTIAELMGLAAQIFIEPVLQKIFFLNATSHITPKQIISYNPSIYAASDQAP